jgi:hypothetical protein
MTEKYKDEITIIGIISGLIIFLVSAILGQVYFNTIFWICTGIAIIVGSLAFFKHTSGREMKEIEKEENKRLAQLMQNGRKITVDLSKCKIRTTSQNVERNEPDTWDEGQVIGIVLDSGGYGKHEENGFSTLIYKHKLDSGEVVKFYGPTAKDKKTLEILCTMQKSTVIYFDRNDPEVYYFDLRFLD